MTTYGHRIMLSSGEATVVKEALEQYRISCELNMPNGVTPREWHKTRYIESVLEKLNADLVMTSTSSFCEPKNEI
jgi:hypothetical protein